MTMAGMDGIENKIDPGAPLEKNTYALSSTEQSELKVMPASLEEALKALEADNDFLLKGDVMTEDAVQTWIDYKRENEIAPVALRPHPHEFELYFDL
jgi:glutamine synthetase